MLARLLRGLSAWFNDIASALWFLAGRFDPDQFAKMSFERPPGRPARSTEEYAAARMASVGRTQQWLDTIGREAQLREPGAEVQRRLAILSLCQIARGDAKMALIICDQLLDEARGAVDDLSAPEVDFSRIPVPNYGQLQERAVRLQESAKRAGEHLLKPAPEEPNG